MLLFLLATTVAADYLLNSQFTTLDCSGPAFASSAVYLQPCTLIDGSSPPGPASSSLTFINSTAFAFNTYASPNCTGTPLSSTPSRTQNNGACVSNSTETFVQGAYQRAPTGIYQSVFAYNAGNQSTWNTCPIPFSPPPLAQEATFSLNCQNLPGPNGEPSGRYNCNSTSIFAEFFGAPNCAGSVVSVMVAGALGCNPGFSSNSPALNYSCALFVICRRGVAVHPLPSLR